MKDESKQFEEVFDAALAARHAGDLACAKRLCMLAIEGLGDRDRRRKAIVYGELGYIHGLEHDDQQSAACYRQSVAFAPRAELPSLGLFHALANQRRWREAMEEAVRFLTSSGSDEYRELFGAGFGEAFEPLAYALVQEARALLHKRLSIN